MKRIITSSLALGLAALLLGCGGGGGSPGDTQLEYHISLRAENDKYQLPLNIGHVPPSKGIYAPYTTILYVNATEGGKPILGSQDAFACNIESGLNTGALYYLDGDPAHEDEDGNPLAYRSITLGANSGGNSFHFHAGSTAGTARIVCTITDPRDQQVKSASVEITVGAGAPPAGTEGMPASVNVQARDPRAPYLGSHQNVNSIPNSIALQAIIRDERNQWVHDSAAPNLQVSIVEDGRASKGARLIRGTQWGSVIQTNSHNGVADFHLTSGRERGVILLQLVADRWDNNVANGIQFPVVQLLAVPVVHAIASEPLAVEEQTVTATCNKSISHALVASGGVPPYQWQALGPLPAGLTLSPDGIVSGTPEPENGANTGTYVVAVQISDQEEVSVIRNMTFQIDVGDCQPLAVLDASISAMEGQSFVFALSATGGTPPYEWKVVAGPPGVTVTPDGILRGSIGEAGTYTVVVEVTDEIGTTVRTNVTITIEAPEPPPEEDPPPTP